MSHLEQSLLERWSGLRIIAISAAIGGAGVLPLLLYVVFGPSHGNPIGLGLLAVIALPVAAVGILIGLVTLLVQLVRRRDS
jgi:hypothetical protein